MYFLVPEKVTRSEKENKLYQLLCYLYAFQKKNVCLFSYSIFFKTFYLVILTFRSRNYEKNIFFLYSTNLVNLLLQKVFKIIDKY